MIYNKILFSTWEKCRRNLWNASDSFSNILHESSISFFFYSPDLAPCDFWLFSKLRGCHYETIEEIKEAVTKVIDTLTQEDFQWAFQKLLELYIKCIAAGGDYFEVD